MKKLTSFLVSSRSSTRRKMATSSTGGSSNGNSSKTPKLHGIVNDMQYQKSPYLLQHKHNPVEWHAWNASTHQLARNRDVPIFLSIGYSSCHVCQPGFSEWFCRCGSTKFNPLRNVPYPSGCRLFPEWSIHLRYEYKWCHVMQHESFENPAIAAIMNEKFVNIKIDREEHPDIDRIYMNFVVAVNGSGGWPLSVWMEPHKLQPIYGGTYYPPDNRYFGRPGFKSLLSSISEQWEENREKCIDSAANIFKLLEKSATIAVSDNLPSGKDALEKCVAQLRRSYEPSFGGFSESPKFPQPGNFVFLIDYCVKMGLKSDADQDKIAAVRKMVERSLAMMAKGGIWDHVGKGMARYSTDKKWHVPHFEKMLYDQAQLTEVYANCYKLTGDEVFGRVSKDIIEYVLRDLRHPEGGFFSAEDADSENSEGVKREGAFYVWTSGEIDEVVDGEVGGVKFSEVFKFAFGVKEGGNVDPYQDPHDELKLKNVLFEANTAWKCAEKFGIGEMEAQQILNEGKAKLFEYREKTRKRPGLDDKIICSWNGLMIRGLSVAAQSLGKSEYLDHAIAALECCKKYLLTGESDLYRTCYSEEGGRIGNLEEPIKGCVDDFSNFISGCLGVFQATGKLDVLDLAVKLQDKQDELFWDSERGGYFNGRVDPSVIIRMKDDDDGAEPSNNSTSLRNLLELSQIQSVLSLNTSSRYSERIPKLLKQFTDRLEKIPIALPIMSALAHTYTEDMYKTILLDGNNSSTLKEIGSIGLPYGSVIVPVVDGGRVTLDSWKLDKITVVEGEKRNVRVVTSVQELK